MEQLLIGEIVLRGLSADGIFRLSPSSSKLAELQEALRAPGPAAEELLRASDVHVVASALKRLYRDRWEDPVLVPCYKSLPLEAEAQGAALRDPAVLPADNLEALRDLLGLLSTVAHNSDENRMTIENLARVWCPNLVPPLDALDSSTLASLIGNYELLFPEHAAAQGDGGTGARDEPAAADGGRLVVQVGDITKIKVDAIVNAANCRMLGGGGVDGAIHRAAGPELRAACEKVEEVSPGVRCPVGEARVTKAYGKLKARLVVATVGPDCRPVSDDTPTAEQERQLRACYLSCLELAEQEGVTSLSFPAISAGVFGFPVAAAAEVAASVCREWLDGHALPETVLFIAMAPSQRSLSRAPDPRYLSTSDALTAAVAMHSGGKGPASVEPPGSPAAAAPESPPAAAAAAALFRAMHNITHLPICR